MTGPEVRTFLWWYTTATRLRVELELCPRWRPWRRRRLERQYRRACTWADLARAAIADQDADLGPGLDATLTVVLHDRPEVLE
jgi:hypothetical protein